MKIGNIMTIILMVGLVFAIFTFVVNDLKTQYPTNTVDNSSWGGYYNPSYTDSINKSASELQADFERIGSGENYWLSFESIAVFPRVILNVIKVMFQSMGYMVSMFSYAGSKYFPPEVMVFGVVLLIVIILISLINWWHMKSPA